MFVTKIKYKSLKKKHGFHRHVIALDRDEKRLEILKKMVGKSEATCVTAKHQDFLAMKSTDEDAQNIEMVLVDPSCSGTGLLLFPPPEY